MSDLFALESPAESQDKLLAAQQNPLDTTPHPGVFDGLTRELLPAPGTGLSPRVLTRGGLEAVRSLGILGAGTAERLSPGLGEPAFDFIDSHLTKTIDQLKPQPHELGAAAGVVSGVAESLAPLVFGGPGFIAAIATQIEKPTEALQKAGVPQDTSLEVGLLNGLAFGAYGAIPQALVATAVKRAAVGAGVGLGLGSLQRHNESLLLDRAGFHDLAKQYAPDTQSAFFDILVGAGTYLAGGRAPLNFKFEGAAGAAEHDAWLTISQGDHAATGTAPGNPISPRDSDLHSKALETAHRQVITDQPVQVPPETNEASFTPRPERAELYDNLKSQLREAGVHIDQADAVAEVIRTRDIARAYRLGLGSTPESLAARDQITFSGDPKNSANVEQHLNQLEVGKPGFYSGLQETIDAKLPAKGSPNEYIQTLNAFQRNGAVKKEELEDSGVLEWLNLAHGFDAGDTKISKRAVLDFLQKKEPAVTKVASSSSTPGINIRNVEDIFYGSFGEVANELFPSRDSEDLESDEYHAVLNRTIEVLAEDHGITQDEVRGLLIEGKELARNGRPARYKEYSLTGDYNNYEETVYSAHDAVGKLAPKYSHGHFPDDVNPVFHTRTTDRQTVDGKWVRNIEEIQSDAHQFARQVGYGKFTSADEHELQVVGLKISRIIDSDNGIDRRNEEQQTELDELYAKQRNLIEKKHNPVPESLPFKKSWPLRAFKEVLKKAVDDGVDAITWTSGDSQVNRYPQLNKKSKEGLKKFYDVNLVNEVKGYVRKWGGEVTSTELPGEGSNHTVHQLVLTPQIRAGVDGGQPFYQGGNQVEAKGRVDITRRNDHGLREFLVTLGKNHDASTPIHELGHIFLEQLGDDADLLRSLPPESLTPVQKQVIADYDTVLAHFGVADRAGIKTKHHEEFARLEEAYFREGEAPSEALKGVFKRFREWLLDIYKHLSNLGVKLTPQLRAVFDRIHATDEELLKTKPDSAVKPEPPKDSGGGESKPEPPKDLASLTAEHLLANEDRQIPTGELNADGSPVTASAREEYEKLNKEEAEADLNGQALHAIAGCGLANGITP